MAEYIDREAAMAAACKALCHPGFLCPDFKCAEVRDAFKAIPAADVRPVVLCRDCLHSVKGKESLECEKHRYVWNNLNRWVNDDDFCSWGVKREES